MFGVLADDANNPFSLDDLALLTHLFDRRSNLHDEHPSYTRKHGLSPSATAPRAVYYTECSLFISIQNASASQIIGRKLHEYAVSGKDLDEVHADLAGNMRQNLVPALETHPKHGIWKVLGNNAFDFDPFLFALFRFFRRWALGLPTPAARRTPASSPRPTASRSPRTSAAGSPECAFRWHSFPLG
jgi:hypothetical protein